MIYDWPSNVWPETASFNRRGMAVAGPPSLTGRRQVGSIDGGYWVAALSRVAVFYENVQAYRAFRALLEGGAHQARVPVFDAENAPWPIDEAGEQIREVGPVRYSDGSSFGDGATFFQPAIAAYVAEAAPLRSTRLVLSLLKASALMGSEYLSVGNYLHEVKAILVVNGAVCTVAISPPLRAAVAEGEPVNFDNPVCLMQLADEASGDLAQERGVLGLPDMAFVEVSDG